VEEEEEKKALGKIFELNFGRRYGSGMYNSEEPTLGTGMSNSEESTARTSDGCTTVENEQ